MCSSPTIWWSALATRGVSLVGPDGLLAGVTKTVAVVAAHPRPDFKYRILAAFTEGLEDRPETTFGNVKGDVLAHYLPGFVRGGFVELVKNSDWPRVAAPPRPASRPARRSTIRTG